MQTDQTSNDPITSKGSTTTFTLHSQSCEPNCKGACCPPAEDLLLIRNPRHPDYVRPTK